MDTRIQRRYRDARREGMAAAYALYVARGSIAFDALDTEADRQAFRVLERDGMEFHIFVEFDHDAFTEYRNDETMPDGQPYPQWYVLVEGPEGEMLESIGGIGGGCWDGRDEADLDDATKAYIWHDFIDPACDAGAVRLGWAAEFTS